MNEYLNTLVSNKLYLYQQALTNVVTNVAYVRTYRFGHKDKYEQHFCYFGCCYSTCNYKNATIPTDIFNVSNTYQLHQNYHDNKMNESLWFNILKARELFTISGNFTKHGDYITSINDSLTINGLPVNYIYMKPRNFHNDRDKCIRMHFSFNLTTYSKMLLYVVNCRRRRLKYVLFSYLPMDIIKDILYLTSIII